MNHTARCLFLTLAVALLAGCAATGGEEQGRQSLEWRLSALEEAFQEREEQRLASEASLDQRLRQLESRLGMDDGSASLENESISGSPKTYKTPKPTEDPRQGGSPKVDPPDKYRQALQLTRSGQTQQGRRLFEEFLEESPDSEYVPNALYWLGETYYHEGDFTRAILSFKEVSSRFPENDKAPAALLKMGYAYEQLNDMENARFYLQSLVERYPGSKPASLGKKRLQSLGG